MEIQMGAFDFMQEALVTNTGGNTRRSVTQIGGTYDSLNQKSILATNGLSMLSVRGVSNTAKDLLDKPSWVERSLSCTSIDQMLMLRAAIATGRESAQHMLGGRSETSGLLRWGCASIDRTCQEAILTLVTHSDVDLRVIKQVSHLRVIP